MKISEIILDKIAKSHALDAYVKSAVSKISEHISSNKMIFFPEYTDHDVSHFEAVLETAVDLATVKSFELMSDIDLAVLTTSVMLHDLGMHLTKEGFQTLISLNGPLKPIDGFGDLPWNELWVSFLAEARRFDDRKLESLLGPKFKPVVKFPSFEDPWNEFDLLLVGEFLRLHHPRLAHEIALQGMPSVGGVVLLFCGANTAEEKFLSDISGLVARSHGMGLRQTFSYLEKNYGGKVETRSAHPVFLMALLRIADYMQIQSTRAPTARTQVSKFRSPISTREWSVHQCVSDITNIADPEAINITARPEDVETFLRLKFWVDDLQRELDVSWAVLGEVYGLQSHSGLNKLGMRLRRVKSNLDEVADFSQTVNYVPEKISFETAGSDLLKLLVGPLYANDISIGLRELVQNATDAVKELDQLVSDGTVEKAATRSDIKKDVQVDFIATGDGPAGNNPKIKEIVVTDRGVGMSLAVVKNYFLRAGASLRNSDAWKEHFEEADGLNKVQRSGRFGVGALAAFLLGDKITVETRHYSEPSSNGLLFSAGLETASINILRHECEIGTKIRIKVPARLQQEVGNLLPSKYQKDVDFNNGISDYFGRYPELTYEVNHKEIPWDKTCYLPSAHDPYQDPWNFFETKDFEVNWCFGGGFPELSVNQIRVSGKKERKYPPFSHNLNLDTALLNTPSLSLGDNSGSFPLNLQRNLVATKKLPFAKELVADITDEFVFTCAFQHKHMNSYNFPQYNGLNIGPSYNEKMHVWLHCSEGMILNNPLFLTEYSPEFALMRYGGVSDLSGMHSIMQELPKKSIAGHEANDWFTARKYKLKGMLTGILEGRAPDFIRGTANQQNVYVPQAYVDLIRKQMKPGQFASDLLDGLGNDQAAEWLARENRNLDEPLKILEWRKSFDKSGSSTSVISLHKFSSLKGNSKKANDAVVFDRWMELVGTPYFPNSKNDIDKLLCQLKRKLGDKFDVFERRANKKRQEQEAKNTK